MKKLLLMLSILFIFTLSSCSLFSTSSTDITTSYEHITDSTLTEDTESLNNYYKIEEVNYTYHDIGQEDEIYFWKYLNSIGDQNILIVPVKINEYADNCTDKTIEDLNITFFGEDNDRIAFESLKSYYYKSSYGKLNISGTITSWMGGYDSETFNTREDESDPLQTLYDDFDEFITSEIDDLTIYDNNEDGYIDTTIFIYSALDSDRDGSLDDNYWAYCYSCEDYEANLESPKLHNFIWASFDFMYENMLFKNKLYANTYIHEFGHSMGLDDYYSAGESYDYTGESVMMSSCVCDHDAFSKFALGWIKPYVVYGNSEITIGKFYSTGDAIILPLIDPKTKEFDSNAFSEYLIFEYYSNEGLNYYNSINDYDSYKGISGEGIRVFYINAKLYYEDHLNRGNVLDYRYDFYEGLGTGIYPAYSNTKDYSVSNSKNTLIRLLDASKESLFRGSTASKKQLYTENSTLNTEDYKFVSSFIEDYTITFKANEDETFTITFTKKDTRSTL